MASSTLPGASRGLDDVATTHSQLTTTTSVRALSAADLARRRLRHSARRWREQTEGSKVSGFPILHISFLKAAHRCVQPLDKHNLGCTRHRVASEKSSPNQPRARNTRKKSQRPLNLRFRRKNYRRRPPDARKTKD